MKILDHRGQPMRRDALKKEIAAPTLSGVRSVMTGYPADGLDPSRLASILRAADQGDPLKFFELAEICEERDLHYAGVLATRKRSVAQLDIIVEPASDDARHVNHADMVRDWIVRDELGDEIFDMLDAIGKGISMTEIVWDTSEGQWQPQRLEWRDPRWFRFDRIDGKTPVLIGDNGRDEEIPGFKFIQTVIKAKSGLPIRSGIARIAVWAWMFKMFTMRDWAIFVQTYGQPIRVGKYGPGASDDEKDTLFAAVANIAADCAAIVPDSMLIEFIQSNATGDHSKLYRERADWLDQQISKAVLGQTTTTDAVSGGHAVSKEHRKVQEDIERADAKALAGVINRDLIRPWVILEHGPQDKYPRIRIGRPDELEVKLVVESVEKLVPYGLRVRKSDMNELLGLPVPEAGDDILGAPPAAQEGAADTGSVETQAALMADGRGATILTAADKAASDISAWASDDLADAIKDIADETGNLDDMRKRLLERQPDLPLDQLAQALRDIILLSHLKGRLEIAEGV